MHLSDKISPQPVRGLSVKTISVALAFIFFFVPKLFGQFSEDFSDGNLTENPAWSGTRENFIVNANLQLQLNAPAAGTSWLSLPASVSAGEHVEWEFYVKQSFSPSGANYGRVYLMSDRQELTEPLNGIYLQLGEPGSNDAVELFRQRGDDVQSLCRATPGAISAPFEIGVKVKFAGGLWEVLIDYNGGTDYVSEASAIEEQPTGSSFFGMVCTHTVTNGTRFCFDNIRIRKSTPPDTSPPQIASLSFASANSIVVTFSEEVEAQSAEDPRHYLVSPENLHPTTVRLQDDRLTSRLVFDSDFRNGYEITLSVMGVADTAGNALAVIEQTLLYFVAMPVNFGDVVITEIFADPEPSVHLPSAEFVELFNRSAYPVQLNDWHFSDGVSAARLPAHMLLPRHYVILCGDAADSEFLRFGAVITLSNFPTLNNGGDALSLRAPASMVIDSVHYSADWYRDDDKAAGGWSLERIDPGNFCADAKNWLASESPIGGTPGTENSVHATMPDNTGPRLLHAVPTAADSLLVVFNEKLDAAPPTLNAFSIEPPMMVEAVSFGDVKRTSVILKLAGTISTSRDYTLRVSAIYDCPGNAIQDEHSSCTFAMPEEASPSDIVINEILFNPRSTGVDFVEVYNRSEKTIDLQDWSIRNIAVAGDRNSVRISTGPSLIRPKAYRVFTEDAVVLSGEYINSRAEVFLETKLPPLNDEAGTVVLLRHDGLTIDSVAYTKDMHSPFLKHDEGVSLERISPAASGSEPANWHSASAATGHATPGYANSALRANVSQPDEPVSVEPEIIQPMVATRNFARIRFRFARTGLMANVRIFDAEGRPIRQIAENELLGSEGFFRWDGDRDNGLPARTGYYQIWFEVFDAMGFQQTYQKRIAVY